MSNLDKYTVEVLDCENKELKARVNHLESAIKEAMTAMVNDEKSLSDIKADAIMELINEEAYSAPIDGIATSIIDADGAIKYADKLRSGK